MEKSRLTEPAPHPHILTIKRTHRSLSTSENPLIAIHKAFSGESMHRTTIQQSIPKHNRLFLQGLYSDAPIEKVEKIIAHKKYSINYQNKFGITSLHAACIHFSNIRHDVEKCDRVKKIISLLCNCPLVNVLLTDHNGKTPLDCLTSLDKTSHEVYIPLYLKTMFYQADHGHYQDNTLYDCNGNTPLIHAVYTGDISQIKTALECPVLAINHQNRFGNTALHIAALIKNKKIIQLLLSDHRINAGIANNKGLRPRDCIIATDKKEKRLRIKLFTRAMLCEIVCIESFASQMNLIPSEMILENTLIRIKEYFTTDTHRQKESAPLPKKVTLPDDEFIKKMITFYIEQSMLHK
jgi:hypothetical protein